MMGIPWRDGRPPKEWRDGRLVLVWVKYPFIVQWHYGEWVTDGSYAIKNAAITHHAAINKPGETG